MNQYSDQDILEKLKSDNEAALDYLFLAYYEKLCLYAFTVLKNKDIAEEIVQDVFVKLWEQHRKLNIETSIKAYLFRTVHNHCINYFVIKPGSYNIGGTAFNLTKNIKIRGLYRDTLPVIYMSGATSTANMLNIATTSQLNYIRFENIEFSGYLDNVSGGTKIGYMFNQSTACTLGELSFTNCVIRNIGNTPVRLKDAPIKTITNLSFDKCKIFDIGNSSVYALVNNNVAGCSITNISFTNSTVYNFAGSIVLHTTANSNSVTLQNCTFNEISTSGTGTSIRYIIDYNTYTVTSGVTIQNCIFGSTPRAYTDGVRVSTSTNKLISGSYFTSDYKDNNAATTFSIMGSLTAYSGLSTALFKAPTNGDFSIIDAGFAGKSSAGDPRWRP